MMNAMTSQGTELTPRSTNPSTKSSYVIVDVETTGFSPAKGDAICEIALVSLDSTGEVVDEWHSLINPRRSTGAVHIHGITPQMVSQAPTIDQVLDAIWQRLAGRVLVAHHAPFDLRFLSVLPDSHWITESLCTQRLAPDFLPHEIGRASCR